MPEKHPAQMSTELEKLPTHHLVTIKEAVVRVVLL